MIKVAPSILSADFGHLDRELQSVESADYIHFDVMDGIFVPNISFGMPILKCVRKLTKLPLDVHLMIEKPIRYAAEFADLGADIVTVHAESDEPKEILKAMSDIKSAGKRCGISIKPATPVPVLETYIEMADLVLVMTVEPGFGGQKFIAEMADKIRCVKRLIDERNPECELEVDGGINGNTAGICIDSGANVLVAGSSVFGEESRERAILELRRSGV